jgi:hypothetical protein
MGSAQLMSCQQHRRDSKANSTHLYAFISSNAASVLNSFSCEPSNSRPNDLAATSTVWPRPDSLPSYTLPVAPSPISIDSLRSSPRKE